MCVNAQHAAAASEDVLTSIQHLGLPALVPHTIIVSFTFWMTVMKLSHSSCERKKRQWRQKMRQKTEGRRKKYTDLERGLQLWGVGGISGE